jgi:hypothetical protein
MGCEWVGETAFYWVVTSVDSMVCEKVAMMVFFWAVEKVDNLELQLENSSPASMVSL